MDLDGFDTTTTGTGVCHGTTYENRVIPAKAPTALPELVCEIGLDESFDQGYDQGREEGYDEGHADGYGEGKEEGYNCGWEEGQEDLGTEVDAAYDRGCEAGYDDGHNDGYDAGYTDCQEEFMNKIKDV